MPGRRRVTPPSEVGRRRPSDVLTLCAAVLAMAAPPAGAVGPTPQRAFATTTFSSAATSATTFTLARDSVFVLSNDLKIREIAVSGAGRVAGLVVAREGATIAGGGVLWMFKFNGCWTARCTTPADEKLFPYWMGGSHNLTREATGDGGFRVTLPAGRYRAYVVADGAPVTAKVSFTGATGTGRLPMRSTVRHTFKTAENSFAGQPFSPHAVYSAGATAPTTAKLNLLVSMMESRSVMHAHSASGTCYYADEAEPPGGTYAPGCPGGAGQPLIVVNGVAPFHRGVIGVALADGPRSWTQGVFTNGVDAREWVSPTALLWLSLS